MANQIKKKFIGQGQVGSSQILIEKDAALKGTLQDGSEVELLKLNASDEILVKGEVVATKAMVDTEKGRIDAILLAADADKDSFAEIVSLINSVDTENDNAFASYVLSNDAAVALKADKTYVDTQDSATLTSAQGYADAAVLVEKNRAEGVESALDGRLDILEPKVAALEALEHKKFKKTLVAGDITAGYVDLPELAVAGSTVAFVDRLAIHEGAAEDYSVSVVGGVTRITFLNDLVHPGQSALQAGDNLFVKYVK